MAILSTDDRNIVEADAINWRIIVYPLLAVAVILLGGFGFYYYQLNERDLQESQARAALVQAKTPQEMVKVADQYPKTTQAALALLSAADASFNASDYTGATQYYQRVASARKAPPELRDSARLGLGSSLAARGRFDEAIQAYLQVAQKRSRSPFAPAAFYSVAQIYADRKDKANQQNALEQTVQLGGDSPFVKEAADQLKALLPPPPAETLGLPETNAATDGNASPVSAPAATAPVSSPAPIKPQP